MAAIDIICPSYRGAHPDAQGPMTAMVNAAMCQCWGDRRHPHAPWNCPNGLHHPRALPMVAKSSVVHWARNQSIAMALHWKQPGIGERPPAEFFLMTDDDMLVEPHYLKRLASYKLDIIGGVCTTRMDPPAINIRYWREGGFHPPLEWDFELTKLMEVDGCGAAFVLVKRRVFERMAEAHLNCVFELAEDLRKVSDEKAVAEIKEYWKRKAELRRIWFNEAIQAGDWRAADCWWFQFPDNCEDRQKGEMGEDLAFCWKAKKLGFRIFIDPQIQPGHIGTYGFGLRDYRSYLAEARRDGKLPKEFADNTPHLMADEALIQDPRRKTSDALSAVPV